jgi:hypothetical protein
MGPTSDVTDMRVAKTANMSFTVKNNSQQSMSVGQIALAIRGPNGENNDLPLVNPGTLAAGASYTYSKPFTPQGTGVYRAFITDTVDGGVSWNETDYPAPASGISRSVQLSVKPNPTLTQGPSLSVGSPHVGQQVTTSFKVKNFGSNAVNVGLVGIAIRDPQGRNVDSGSTNLTVNADTEYIFQADATFHTPGTYTAWITSYHNGGWDDTSYPALEDASVTRKVTFTVLPNPTMTVQPTITTTSPRVGKALSATFTVHNYGSQAIDAGQVALVVRDPQGRNVDFPLQSAAIAAGSDYVYTATNVGSLYKTPGTYTAWITSYHNGSWDDGYPVGDSNVINRKITFTVAANPTVTTSVSSSVASPTIGQTFTLSFKVKNFGDSTTNLGYVGLGGRDALDRNVDPGVVPVTLAAGEEKTITFDVTASATGKLNYFIISTPDYSSWGVGPDAESSSISKTLSITIGS